MFANNQEVGNDIHSQFFQKMYSMPEICMDTVKLVMSPEEYSLLDWDKMTTAPSHSASAYGERVVDVTHRVSLQADPNQTFIVSLAFTHENIMKTIESLMSYYIKLVEKTNGFALGILIYNCKDKFNLPGDYLRRLLLEKIADRPDHVKVKLLDLMSDFVFRVMELQSSPIGVMAVKLVHRGDADPRTSCRLKIPTTTIESAPSPS